MSITPEQEKMIRGDVVAACEEASKGMALGENMTEGFLDTVDLSLAAEHLETAAMHMRLAYRIMVDLEDPPIGAFA